jgi:integrase
VLHWRKSRAVKDNILVVNKAVHKSLRKYMEKVQPRNSDYLFTSRKGNKAITIQAVNNMIKKWTRAINLAGNYGAHTLRKTWGYMQRTRYGVGFEIICKRYNLSSPAVTMRCLGIEDKEGQYIGICP